MKLHRSGATGPYRPEVDGLRAMAVLAVMLFHAGLPWAAGGWLGVDIFFVISGYLIMRLIAGEQAGDGFSLRRFYVRRIRRILPALLLTMALATPFALLWMLPDQLTNFGQSLTASALMGNNVLLWLTGGYWSEPAQFKPLAHTWSLGVEEQFYLLLPPLLALALRRGGQRGLRTLLGLLIVATAGVALAWDRFDTSATFLLLPARIWELAAGALVATIPVGKPSPAVAWLGLAAMLVPMGLFAEGLAPAPVLMAVPVAGCALFLHSGQAAHGAGKVLALRPLVAIGLVSYSAYLFHQPVFAFWRLMSWQEPPAWQMVLAIPAILGAAWASWRWIERPARSRERIGDRALLATCVFGVMACALFGLILHRTAGFSSDWPELAGAGHNETYVNRAYAFDAARLDPEQRRNNLLVIGNSMGRDIANAAHDGAGIAAKRIGYVETLECSPAAIEQSLGYAARADTVILATTIGRGRAACYAGWLERLAAAGVSYPLVAAPKHFGWSINHAMRLSEAERIALRVEPLPAYRVIKRELHAAVPPARLFDPLGPVIDDAGRAPLFTPEGQLITQDRIHLTPAGARWLGDKLFTTPQLRHLADQS